MHRLGAVALVVVVLVGCNAAVAPSRSANGPASQVPAASAPVQTASAAPATAAPSPAAAAANAAPLPAGAAWQRVGSIKEGFANGAFVLDGPYVVFGQDAPAVPWVWTSTDGSTWAGTKLGELRILCPEGSEEPDSKVYRGATDGQRAILVGWEVVIDAPRCGAKRAVAWVSDDGISWTRGKGFAGNAAADVSSQNVWAVGGGWEALAGTGVDDPLTLWRSVDGLTWTGGASLDVPPSLRATITAGADGTRLMVVTNDQDGSQEEAFGVVGGASRLRWSVDGTTWKDVANDFSTGGPTRLSVAVDKAPATGNAWIVIGDRGDGTPVTIWRSTDLMTWASAMIPKGFIASLAWTRYGYLATARDVGCGDGGGDCTAKPGGLYRSEDGSAWAPVELPGADDLIAGAADHFIDGPAGVLAIDGDSGTWILR